MSEIKLIKRYDQKYNYDDQKYYNDDQKYNNDDQKYNYGDQKYNNDNSNHCDHHDLQSFQTREQSSLRTRQSLSSRDNSSPSRSQRTKQFMMVARI